MLNIIFPKKSPTVNGFQFDAVLEDTFEATVEPSLYPVESGAMVNDHRIINPMKYFITGAIGSKPLRPLISPDVNIDDLAGIAIGAATNLFRKNPLIATAAGLGIGYLAGTEDSRGSTSLAMLIDLMRQGMPFDVDAVDIQLKNMVITKIRRTKDTENEQGLVVVLEIQELITLDRINEMNGERPTLDQLIDGDPSQTSCTRDTYRGQQMGSTSVDVATSTAVTQSVIIPSDIPPLQ